MRAAGCRRSCPAAWRSARRLRAAWRASRAPCLLDEPFGALDEVTRADMQRLLIDSVRALARPRCSSRTTSTKRSSSPTASAARQPRHARRAMGSRPAASATDAGYDRSASCAYRYFRRCRPRCQRPPESSLNQAESAGILDVPITDVTPRVAQARVALHRRGRRAAAASRSMRAPPPNRTRPCASAICRSPMPTPLLVAHNNGYFDAAGIQAEKPTLLRSWAQLVEAFLSGQVNVVHLLSPMTVWARYGGKRAREGRRVESRERLGADGRARCQLARRPRRQDRRRAVLVFDPQRRAAGHAARARACSRCSSARARRGRRKST